MSFLKYLLFTACILFATVCNAQNRNKSVRELNHIIELMNAFSQCHQDWYFDALQLQKALHMSSKKVNENYFYCSKTQHGGLLSYTDIELDFRFKEITPNKENQIPAYQADYIPWLKARETVLNIKAKPKSEYTSFGAILDKYLASADSLYSIHEELINYVSEKKYRSDDQFQAAKRILRTHERFFKACYSRLKELDNALVEYCNFHYPPFQTHKELQQGLQELNLTMDVLTNWEKELYAENLSNNAKYDAKIRQLNATGLKNDSLYLYKTRGYGVLRSGFWLHTRYRTFYTSMHSRLYWFATSKYAAEPYVRKPQQAYNEFVRSYNAVVEDYNDYIAIADGLTFRKTSECCLSPSEIDTHQNVLLMAPRLIYKFEYSEELPPSIPKDSALANDNLSKEELLIQKAAPHHLVYLLDASSSMNESGKLAHLKENATNLVSIQREADRISVVTFSGKSDILLQFVPCNQKKHINEKIERIHAFGQTNIQRGFETVKTLLASDRLEKGVNAVLLITDGEFTLSNETQAILNEFKNTGIPVYFIYLGKPLSKKETKAFQKAYTDMGVVLYDTNKIDLKEALLKIATE
jgi:Mg-chelatase subunit ChlD